MRGSLRDAALKKATADLRSLGAVFRFCESQPKYRDSCSAAGEFWKQAIEKYRGNIIVLQRGDLEERDWYDFARLLVQGVQYEYCVEFDVNGVYATQPLPLAEIDGETPDSSYVPLIIPAMLPARGTQGFYVRTYTEPPFEIESTSFFVHADQAVAQNRVTRFVADSFHSRFAFVGRWMERGVTISFDGNPPIDLDEFPEVAFFVDTVRARLAAGSIGGGWELTFSRMVFDANGISRMEPAEAIFSWEISPITF